MLLVDDQDLFRDGVRVIVDAQDGMHVVGTAGDGLEAVRLVDELQPDVVLMDVRMPEMDGVEATRQIFAPERVARRAKPVRVVVLTTFDLDDRAATAIRHGASGFLLKDTTPAELATPSARCTPATPCSRRPTWRTLLERQLPRPRPTPPAFLDAHRQGARGVRRRRPRPVERRDRRLVFASESTVKTHVGAILRKLGLRDRVQIVVFAHEHHLLG